MGGCNCGANKKSTGPVTYIVTTPSGEKKTYKNKVEAVAAATRLKGTWMESK